MVENKERRKDHFKLHMLKMKENLYKQTDDYKIHQEKIQRQQQEEDLIHRKQIYIVRFFQVLKVMKKFISINRIHATKKQIYAKAVNSIIKKSRQCVYKTQKQNSNKKKDVSTCCKNMLVKSFKDRLKLCITDVRSKVMCIQRFFRWRLRVKNDYVLSLCYIFDIH